MQPSSSTNTTSHGARRPSWLWGSDARTVALLGGYLVLWYIWAAVTEGSPIHARVGTLGLLPMDLGVAILLFARARRTLHNRQRSGLFLASAALLAYLAGDLLWFLFRETSGVFSPAEWAYGLYYLLMLAALCRLMNLGRSPIHVVRLLLDASLVVSLGAMIAWQTVVFPALTGASGAMFKVSSLTGPILNVAVLFAAAILLLQSRSASMRRATALMGAGVLMQFVAGVLFLQENLHGNYASGGWSDIFTMTSFFVFLLGAMGLSEDPEPARGVEEEIPSRFYSLLPYAAVVGTHVDFLWVAFAGPPSAFKPITFFAGGVTALLLTRQLIALEENQRLLRRSFSLNKMIAHSEARFRSLFQNSSDVISIVDRDGIVRYQTPSGGRIFGYDVEKVIGAPLLSLIYADDRPEVELLLEDLCAGQIESEVVRWRMLHADQESWSHTETVVTSLLTDPEIQGFLLNTRDVSERALLEEEMRYRAYSDPLTGLANRVLFRDRLEEAIAHGPFAVLLLDLDGFKNINDSLGHHVGDQLLVAVADRLRNYVHQAKDTVARLGGDEFAIILDGATQTNALLVAGDLVSVLEEPLRLPDREVQVGTSIGVTTSLRSEASPDAILRDADAAMYSAKAKGKGCVSLYEPGMHAEAVRRMEMEADLRQAVANGEFVVYYQPEIGFDHMQVRGFEALVRWQHPRRGLLAPGEFIEVAEEVGLIGAIDRLVMHEALGFLGRVKALFPDFRHGFVAVNVSGYQTLSPEVPGEIAHLLEVNGLEPESLIMEITESTMIQKSNWTLPILDELRAMGVRIAVDDFGTGYSALSYLKDLPVDILKIDRSFIMDLGAGERQNALVKGIVDLSKALGLSSVAEGIEDKEKETILCGLGCTYGQGYYYSRPLPESRIGELLQSMHQKSL